jgi:hypothetical protein
MTAFEAISWLEAAARYFEKRDTKGEDRAHWSNVYNAQNCRNIADLIKELCKDETQNRKSSGESTPVSCM